MRKYPIGKSVIVLALAVFLAGTSSICTMANPEESASETEEAVKPAPSEFAHITSCAIEGGNQIAIRGQMEGTWSDPVFYDNYLYLFELQPYQDSLDGRTDYCGWITKGDALSFDIPLNLGTEKNRLYSRFVVAVYDGQGYTQVSNTAYVTNPEVLAKHTDPYRTAQNKKGLLIQNTDSMVADAFELGVNHVIVNLTIPMTEKITALTKRCWKIWTIQSGVCRKKA